MPCAQALPSRKRQSRFHQNVHAASSWPTSASNRGLRHPGHCLLSALRRTGQSCDRSGRPDAGDATRHQYRHVEHDHAAPAYGGPVPIRPGPAVRGNAYRAAPVFNEHGVRARSARGGGGGGGFLKEPGEAARTHQDQPDLVLVFFHPHGRDDAFALLQHIARSGPALWAVPAPRTRPLRIRQGSERQSAHYCVFGELSPDAPAHDSRQGAPP